MKQTNTSKRKQLENKMAKVFGNETQSLSAEYRKIMFDDLVSAFESRLKTLVRAQTQSEFLTIIESEVIEAQ